MDDVFGWIGSSSGSFADRANWFDFNIGFAGAFLPGPNDTVIFPAGTTTVTGGGQVNLLLFEPGADVTLAGTGTERFSAGTAIEEPGSTVTLLDARLSANFLSIDHDAHLDVSHGGTDPGGFFDPDAPASFGDLRLLGPSDMGGGGTIEFGSRNILVGRFDNGNSGSGNAFDPGLGLSGTGHPELGPTSFPIAYVVRSEDVGRAPGHELTSLDFGILHVGDPATLSYAITNYSGDAGYPSTGAIQTAAHGGNVTDPSLSGNGVTAQDFLIPGRGAFQTYDVSQDTSHTGTLQDQAVHIAYLFNRNAFNTGVTLPITGTVLNPAEFGLTDASSGGSLSHHDNAWVLDLGSVGKRAALSDLHLTVANLADAPADLLSGSLDVTAPDDAIQLQGASEFSGIAAGGTGADLTFSFDTLAPGPHAETITFHPSGSNDSGFREALPDQTLTVRLDVTPAGRPDTTACDVWAAPAS